MVPLVFSSTPPPITVSEFPLPDVPRSNSCWLLHNELVPVTVAWLLLLEIVPPILPPELATCPPLVITSTLPADESPSSKSLKPIRHAEPASATSTELLSDPAKLPTSPPKLISCAPLLTT